MSSGCGFASKKSLQVALLGSPIWKHEREVVLPFRDDMSKSRWRSVVRRRFLHCLCSICSMFKGRERKWGFLPEKILLWCASEWISIRHRKSWERGKGEGELQPEVICSDLFSVLAFLRVLSGASWLGLLWVWFGWSWSLFIAPRLVGRRTGDQLC